MRLAQIVANTSDIELRRAALDAMGTHARTSRLQRLVRLDEAHLEALREFAIRNRIGPIVAHAILDAFDGDPPQAEAWREIHEASVARMSTMMDVLDEAAATLDAEGITLVALKNAGIARGLHDCPACCPMGDLDVLIDPASFRRAHELLVTAGFELSSRSTVEPADLEHGMLSGGTEYIKRADGKEVWFELQWRPVAGRWIRRDQEPKAADLIARSVAIEGSKARLLRPEDNLLQVCLHTAKHSYVRAPGLRLHTDVDRIVAHSAIDWDAFTARVIELSSRTPCFLSLGLASTLLDTPVPMEVLDELRPPRWKLDVLLRWIRHADIFEPDERKFSRPEMLGFHALLYDDTRGLMASVFDVEPDELRLRRLPTNLRRGARRMWDLVSRFDAG